MSFFFIPFEHHDMFSKSKEKKKNPKKLKERERKELKKILKFLYFILDATPSIHNSNRCSICFTTDFNSPTDTITSI